MGTMVPSLEQIDELHHKIAPSEEAYELVHTHCVIVATIGQMVAKRANALFMRRCTLPRRGDGSLDPTALAGYDGSPVDGGSAQSEESEPSSQSHAVGFSGGSVPPRLIDTHLVMIGGLLHDIGTYRVFKHDGRDGKPLKFDKSIYIQHGLKGYEYLLDEGVDESIAEFARNHTGVGLTREAVVAQGLPLPPDDYVPVNLEQEIVMYADKFHSKSVPPKFLTVDAYTARAERFGEDNKRTWLELVDKWGVPDVPTLAARYAMRVKTA